MRRVTEFDSGDRTEYAGRSSIELDRFKPFRLVLLVGQSFKKTRDGPAPVRPSPALTSRRTSADTQTLGSPFSSDHVTGVSRTVFVRRFDASRRNGRSDFSSALVRLKITTKYTLNRRVFHVVRPAPNNDDTTTTTAKSPDTTEHQGRLGTPGFRVRPSRNHDDDTRVVVRSWLY